MEQAAGFLHLQGGPDDSERRLVTGCAPLTSTRSWLRAAIDFYPDSGSGVRGERCEVPRRTLPPELKDQLDRTGASAW